VHQPRYLSLPRFRRKQHGRAKPLTVLLASTPLHHRRGKILNHRRADLLHSCAGLDAKDIEHALNTR